ncbi:hypothetical protein [Kaarinaea lacus]
MELIWLFGAVFLIAIVYLNYMCTQIIQSSQIHSAEKKQKLVLIVWLLPVLGVFLALFKINKDIKKNREKVEGEIAPAIRELADKLKTLESDIQREKQKELKQQQTQEQQQESNQDPYH